MLVSHSACIWNIKNFSCEHMHDPSKACVAKGCSGGVSFATCSADGSIRLWDLELQSSSLPLPTEDKSMSTLSAGSTHLGVSSFLKIPKSALSILEESLLKFVSNILAKIKYKVI